MLSSKYSNKLMLFKQSLQSVRIGDWLVMLLGVIGVVFLFQTQWDTTPATKVQVQVGDKVFATYSLNLRRDIKVQGVQGEATIQIGEGKARFLHSPCHNQYCVHQGWLTRAGQVAICLPNQVTLELLGENKPYDSLNY
jgi:hypothetical protein